MSRLPRLGGHRYVGVRDSMRVYDCDVESEFEQLGSLIESDDLIRTKQIQTFGPDTVDEARNRGFSAFAPVVETPSTT